MFPRLCIQALENKDRDGHFSANHRPSQVCVPIGRPTLPFFASGGVPVSWLAVDTSDMSYIVKLVSGNLTSWVAGDTVSQLESSWDKPVYTYTIFPATVSSCCDSLV